MVDIDSVGRDHGETAIEIDRVSTRKVLSGCLTKTILF